MNNNEFKKLNNEELELIFTLYDGMKYETIIETICEKRKKIKITNINAIYDKKSTPLHIVNKNQKYTLEDLMKKKHYELIEICKVMGITGYWVNDKNRLIQLIRDNLMENYF